MNIGLVSLLPEIAAAGEQLAEYPLAPVFSVSR
jgi:hypothetical protein